MNLGHFVSWCGRGDSNPYDIAIASPSSWCVCQFRHFRVRGSSSYLPGVAGAEPCAGAGVGAGVVAAGAGDVVVGVAGVEGAVGLLTGGGGVPLTTDPGPRWPMTDNTSAPSMNKTAKIVVSFVSSVAPPRAPNAAWLPPPPKALAMSPPLPCCSRITSSRMKQMSTYAVVKR
jgi:hypothetical protein